MFSELAGHVHGTQGVLKTAMFSGGKDPTGTLKLINVTQPLHPGGVDECLLGHFGFVLRDGELNVAMDGISDECCSLVFAVGKLSHECSDFKN